MQPPDMPGVIPSSQQPCDINIIGPIFQTKKLRFREADRLAS